MASKAREVRNSVRLEKKVHPDADREQLGNAAETAASWRTSRDARKPS